MGREAKARQAAGVAAQEPRHWERQPSAATFDRLVRAHSPALADDIAAHRKADRLASALTAAIARRTT
jgi:hypothetical protein